MLIKSIEGMFLILFGLWSIISCKRQAQKTVNFYNKLPKWLALRSKQYQYNLKYIQFGYFWGGIVLSIIGLLLLLGIIN